MSVRIGGELQMDDKPTGEIKRQWIETFHLEAEDLLTKIEDAILDLEQDPGDTDSLHRLFRAMHTIKGSGAMFGYDAISGLAHHVESVLNEVREGTIPMTDDLIYLILLSRDRIKAMLDKTDDDDESAETCDYKDLAEALRGMIPKISAQKLLAGDGQTDFPASPEKKERVYAIRFKPNRNIMSSGMDPSLLLDELDELGECRVAVLADAVPALEELKPDECYLVWDIILKTVLDVKTVQDIFIFVEGNARVDIREICDEDTWNAPESKLGDILMEKGDVPRESIDKALSKQKRLGELLVESGTVSKDRVESALAEQATRRDLKNVLSESVRVPSGKLDTLINLVGELLINQALLARAAASVRNTELADPLVTLERLAADLRDCALNMRMMPVGTLFARFRRLVRDLSVELGKKIEFVTEGEETEMDKTVIERMSDPLIHLIRNSIDHGIRSPEERALHGKPPNGTIRLTASHKGSRVEIAVSDDGIGIDPATVRSKAVEKGLIAADASLPESEIFNLIFAPGFSTSENVTSVSGRGVGMDVVKRAINALGGAIIIESKKGTGTTIRLSLPLTLAIIEGLLVNVAGRQFVLPLEHVEECCEIELKDFEKKRGRNVIPFREELLPFVRMDKILRLSEKECPSGQLVIAQIGNFRVGLVVDAVVRRVQTVIKPLGKIYRNAEGFSGATIMGDGKVALIVDIPGLVEQTKRDREKLSLAVA